ncbi:hypothetical protein P154DRAFT_586273 [Amniculicola lignicola CBS 123094]|uniref:Uncharacterized protein n=1 Tax=Amniculicola lignicola CBS 123094 TaxID=1392246 RepID=A0A6A5X203_9PLEO|nr:hypothetical protein P154DRAFT_586273 [Amniculicola lignicola CBS 123094]
MANALVNAAPDPNKQTQVALSVGDGSNNDGSVPHVALWDRNGARIAQYRGNDDGHIKKSTSWSISLDNEQADDKQVAPEYASIVMQEGDAICLAMIAISGNSQTWVWTGDVGYTCDAQWYNSKFTTGGSNIPMKCVWLDADHTGGTIAKGLGIHLRDFTGDAGLIYQYDEDQRRLCQNSARMTFYPEIDPDSLIPFFNPPLDYMSATVDGDPTKIPTGGAITAPDQGVDRQMRAYPDGTKPWFKAKRSTARSGVHNRRNLKVRGLKNNKPERLTISSNPHHSAIELCEHPSSLGDDFVATVEGTYCDMQTGKWWYLCTAEIRNNCFDLASRVLKAISKRDQAPGRNYTMTREW